MRLAITLATRGRPQQLVDTINRSIPNWVNASTRLYVMADEDDAPTQEAVTKRIAEAWHNSVVLNVRAREDTIAEKWNRVVALAPDAVAYLVAADDDPYITPGYDATLLEAAARFDDGIGMVYGRMANASFSGCVCPTRGLVHHMGNKIFPEYFPYWFVDHWTDDLARLIGRISFADVATDQSRVGKTQEMREPGWWATFYDAGYMMRRAQAKAIITDDAFQATAAQKDLLLTHSPLIEFRSSWINDNVRQTSRQLEGWSGLSNHDERYQRIRTRARDTLGHFLNDYGMDPQEARAFEAALYPPTTVVSLPKRYSGL